MNSTLPILVIGSRSLAPNGQKNVSDREKNYAKYKMTVFDENPAETHNFNRNPKFHPFSAETQNVARFQPKLKILTKLKQRNPKFLNPKFFDRFRPKPKILTVFYRNPKFQPFSTETQNNGNE